ncbi:contact-dependent growth inhibition system immunity protein [Amycolatopsis dongchuanensis]|uniref:contact-dependent growth inhibition system immunity protein n=1 Tax=Amycolatopsis TaxID=1813 RepID=UPI0031F97601
MVGWLGSVFGKGGQAALRNDEVRDDLSLEQIEDEYWGEAPADATRLIRTVHDVRRKPLGQLGAEDYRVLLLQQVGVEVLVPRALTQLEREPLWEGDFYPGDVLSAVLQLPEQYWHAHPDQLARLSRIVATLGDATELDAVGAPGGSLRARVDEFHHRVGV